MQNWMTFERQDISPSMLGPKDLAVGALTDHGLSAWPVSTHKSAGKTEGLSRTDYRSNDNRDDDIDIYWPYNCCIIDNYWWILLIITIAYHSTGESILVCLKCSRKSSNSSSFSPVKFPHLWTNLPLLAPGIPTWGNATWFPMRSMGTKSLSTISWDLAVAWLAVWLCGFSLVSKSFRSDSWLSKLQLHPGCSKPEKRPVWTLNIHWSCIQIIPWQSMLQKMVLSCTIWISTGCHPTMVSRIRHPIHPIHPPIRPQSSPLPALPGLVAWSNTGVPAHRHSWRPRRNRSRGPPGARASARCGAARRATPWEGSS